MATKADDYGTAICEALNIDPNKVRRVVIDATAGELLRVYIEYYGGPELVTIKLPATEIEVVDNTGMVA